MALTAPTGRSGSAPSPSDPRFNPSSDSGSGFDSASDADSDQAFGTTPDKGLRAGSLGYLSSVVIAVSSTAPAYSTAATLGLIAAVSGVHTPGMLIAAFLPMLFIAIAFRELNRVEPDCGTTFAWAARAFGPRTGWMGGWGIVAADIIVMASLAQVVGRYALLFVGADGVAMQTAPVVAVGVVFILVMTAVCYRGIEISARLQQVLLAVELLGLTALVVVALVKAGTGHALAGAPAPSVSWLSPWPGSFSGLSDSFLLAVFVYWGWDAALSVNEETRDRSRVPGRAATSSTVVLVAVFALIAIATLAYAGPGYLAQNSGDVISALSGSLFGGTWGRLLILCVLTSTAASTQTTIMPTARAVLSMAAHRAIPTRFARIHPHYRTPDIATLGMGAISVAFFVLLAAVSTNVLADSASAVGLLIAFYYGLTGLSCVWLFRRVLLRSQRDLWLKGVLPGLGSVALLAAFALSVKDYLPASSSASSAFGLGGIFLIGAGSLVLGVLLMLVARWRYPAFFQPGAVRSGRLEGAENGAASNRAEA
jgi:amino acid transporter